MGLFILLIGVQGSGKGTQAKFLVEDYGIPHVSTGDLFRAMKSQDTPLAREVQAILKVGDLVPDETTNRVVAERLSKPDTLEGAILDGYPRTTGQAAWFDSMLAERSDGISLVVVLELDRETGIKRSAGRRYSQDKQRTYNIYFNPPQKEGVDDVDGQPLIQRDDDHLEAVERRIDVFFKDTSPLIDYYEAKGLVKHVDANQPIEAVRGAIRAIVEAVKPA